MYEVESLIEPFSRLASHKLFVHLFGIIVSEEVLVLRPHEKVFGDAASLLNTVSDEDDTIILLLVSIYVAIETWLALITAQKCDRLTVLDLHNASTVLDSNIGRNWVTSASKSFDAAKLFQAHEACIAIVVDNASLKVPWLAHIT